VWNAREIAVSLLWCKGRPTQDARMSNFANRGIIPSVVDFTKAPNFTELLRATAAGRIAVDRDHASQGQIVAARYAHETPDSRCYR